MTVFLSKQPSAPLPCQDSMHHSCPVHKPSAWQVLTKLPRGGHLFVQCCGRENPPCWGCSSVCTSSPPTGGPRSWGWRRCEAWPRLVRWRWTSWSCYIKTVCCQYVFESTKTLQNCLFIKKLDYKYLWFYGYLWLKNLNIYSTVVYSVYLVQWRAARERHEWFTCILSMLPAADVCMFREL